MINVGAVVKPARIAGLSAMGGDRIRMRNTGQDQESAVSPGSRDGLEERPGRILYMRTEYESRWQKLQDKRRRANYIAAFFYAMLFFEGSFPVEGDPPTIHFYFGLFSILEMGIIVGLLQDDDRWRLAVFGLALPYAGISIAWALIDGTLLGPAIVLLFFAGMVSLILFYDRWWIVAISIIGMAILPLLELTQYLVLLF